MCNFARIIESMGIIIAIYYAIYYAILYDL